MRGRIGSVDEPLLLQDRDDRGVVTLTLNRPGAFNALSEAMLTALAEVLDAIAEDDAVRVVVLGASGKAFCAGHDLKEMRAEPSLQYYQRLFAQCTAVMLAIQRLPVPVIARVHGLATAAGCQLVGMCDLAVAARDARFAVSGINVGLFCATPGVALSRNVPRKAAFEMLVTGDFVSAEQARVHPLKNVITRALGGETDVKIDLHEVDVRTGDLYLLCSDGLTTMLSDPDIQRALFYHPNLEAACRLLVDEANARGGLDNVTVVLIEIEDGQAS